MWVNKEVTASIVSDGVAVSILHTGKHYDDDVDESGILYHYPTTARPKARDRNEVQALKNAQILGIPVFVIRNVGTLKKVDLAWMYDFDDEIRMCVLTFNYFPNPSPGPRPETPFTDPVLFGKRKKTLVAVMRAERDPIFKFKIFQRFESKCLISGVDVPEMLDAAHIIPVKSGGTEDPQNGLLLAAGIHRALDAGLWAIHPKTLKIETRPQGPSPLKMKLNRVDLNTSASLLNREALEFRYEKLFLKALKK